jgi:hypothetical protein
MQFLGDVADAIVACLIAERTRNRLSTFAEAFPQGHWGNSARLSQPFRMPLTARSGNSTSSSRMRAVSEYVPAITWRAERWLGRSGDNERDEMTNEVLVP